MPLDVARHLRVHRAHELRAALDEGDVEAEMGQVLGHLEADEAAPDDHRTPGRDDRLEPRVGVEPRGIRNVALEPLADRVDVRHRPHREHAGQVDAGHGWPDRRRPGGQDELVVRLDGDRAGPRVTQLDGPCRGVDRDRLALGPDFDVQLSPEQRRVRQHELRFALDHPAHEVRQAAVRVRDVRAALDHDDLGLLVKATQPRCTGGATGDPTNDDDLHPMTSCGSQPRHAEEQVSGSSGVLSVSVHHA